MKPTKLQQAIREFFGIPQPQNPDDEVEVVEVTIDAGGLPPVVAEALMVQALYDMRPRCVDKAVLDAALKGMKANGPAYRQPAGFHRHECHVCGTVWEHADGSHGNVKAHLCPQCGTECDGLYGWSRYDGPAAPTHTTRAVGFVDGAGI